ncbi:AMP-binding domain protein [compost metagenome]
MSYTSTRFGRRDLLKAGALIAGGAWVNISERAAVPKRIEFVEALPLTAVGKIFKPALQQREIGVLERANVKTTRSCIRSESAAPNPRADTHTDKRSRTCSTALVVLIFLM